MQTCKYMTTWEHGGICTNADCPKCAEDCPVPDTEGVCRYEDREQEQKLIFVRGMAMPQTCGDCPLAFWNLDDEFSGCTVHRNGPYGDVEREAFRYGNVPRPDWCPLVEVTVTEANG